MRAIVNANVVLPDRVLENGQILMENGRILAIRQELPLPEQCECFDAQGMLAGPGFVDEHCHAGGDCWAYEDPVGMAKHHLLGGTTTLLCTIYHDIGVQGALDAMEKVRAAMQQNAPGNIAGLFFEGPFLNPKYGCALDKIRRVDPVEYTRYLREYRDILKLWMVAPELDGAKAFMDAVTEAGIPLAIGHSEADADCVADAVRRGARIAVHLCDATGTAISPSRWDGTLEVSFDVACMLQKELFCEIVNDENGVHVRHDMIRFIIQAVGLDRVIAVTDACTGAKDDTDVNIVDGDLLGSKLCMNQAARNFRNTIGLTEPEVFRVCALNAARALGMDKDVGSLAAGKQANIVLLDQAYQVREVFLRAEHVVQGGKLCI